MLRKRVSMEEYGEVEKSSLLEWDGRDNNA